MPDSDQTLSRNNTDVMDLRKIKGVRFINTNRGKMFGNNKITNSYTDSYTDSDPYSSIAYSYSDFTGFDGFILSDDTVVKFNGLVVSDLCPEGCYGRYIGYYIQNTKDKSKELLHLPLYDDDKGTPYALFLSNYGGILTPQTFQDMLYGLYNSEGARGHYNTRFSAHNVHNKIYELGKIIPGIGSGSDEYKRHKLRMCQIALGVYLRGKFINIKNPLLKPPTKGGSRRGYSYKYKKYVKHIRPSKSKRRAKSRKTRRQRK